MWAALSFEEDARPSSILLTVLIAEAVQGVELDSIADDDLLESIASSIHNRVDSDAEVANPVNANENLNRLSDENHRRFVEELEALVDIASRANGAADKITAAEAWAEAFGHFFPMPEDNDEAAVEKADARNALVPLRFDPQISVVATPQENAHRTWSGLNELPPIPKDCDVVFTLENQPPVGSTLRWTERNRGSEAAMKNDLGHDAGDEISITEHSAFNGDHAMDLAVLMGHQVIGRRRVWVKVRGMAIPPRNPKRRRRF
jgi:hypothetical protein